MNSAIFLIVLSLCSCISANSEGRTWGDVNATELGRIRAFKTDKNMKSFTFTYPEVIEIKSQ